MDVNKLVENVARLGTSESSPGLVRQQQLLDYVNIAYTQLFQEVRKEGRHLTSSIVNVVTSAAGTVTLAAAYAYIHSVRNISNNGQPLWATDVETVEEMDPRDDRYGTPDRYYPTGMTQLNVWPRAAQNLRIRLTPLPALLVLGDPETAVLIPPPYHQAIVWGAILWAATDERDKGFSVEVQFARQQYDKSKGDLILFLQSLNNRDRKVRQWR